MLGAKVIGSGEHPVIILHEWLGDHTNWEPMWSCLPSGPYRYVFADLRGYGLSKDLDGDYTVEEAADDVIRLSRQVGGEQFSLVGHSMSSLVAQKVSAAYAHHIVQQILFCPVPASGFSANKEQLEQMKSVASDRGAIRNAIILRGGGRYGDAWLDQKVDLAWHASSPNVRLAYLEMFTSTDISEVVSGSRMRTTVCYGSDDLPFYQEEAVKGAFGSLYENIEFYELAGCGHYPMRENPQLTAGVLAAVL